jgi:predicted SnoaL-like aldol condensation-catalyzing enzyme
MHRSLESGFGGGPWERSTDPAQGIDCMTANGERNKSIIAEVLCNAFNKRDFATLERHFASQYIQHNPFIPGSRDGLRKYVEQLAPDRRYEAGMAIAEGDLVMIHGRYAGGPTKTLVAVDIFRFENDCVVEHWDVLQEEVPVEKTVAGNPMFTKHVM